MRPGLRPSNNPARAVTCSLVVMALFRFAAVLKAGTNGTIQIVEYTYDAFKRRIGRAVDNLYPFDIPMQQSSVMLSVRRS